MQGRSLALAAALLALSAVFVEAHLLYRKPHQRRVVRQTRAFFFVLGRLSSSGKNDDDEL